MAATTLSTPRRAGLWALGILSMLWVAFGCSPASISMFLLPWADDKIPAKCKLAKKDKEINLVVMTTFSNAEVRPELLTADHELTDRLGQALKKRFEENKEKVKIVPAARVKSYLNQNAGGRTLSSYEVGQHFKADLVVALEVNDISLYEKNSYNQLYRGRTEINVAVVDLSQPRGEGTILDEVYRIEYPGSRPLPVEGSPAQFRSLFLNRIAADLTKWFTAYPSDQRFMVD